jgi:predicted nuclease of predicted toxin-antitoxin system
MRILADENCDRLLVIALREAGHDVQYVADDQRSERDVELFLAAREQGRVLLSSDLGFGRLADLERGNAPGIVLLRLHSMQRPTRIRRVVDLIGSAGDVLPNHILVIEPAQVRLRVLRKRAR